MTGVQTCALPISYRDLWYDKPPLNIAAYLLFGAQGGWILRVASALFASGVCALAYRFAGALWTRREAIWAALLTAFFLIFYFPGSTLTLEPDTLMLAPHFAAVYFAWKRCPFAAGALAGIATLFNVKGLFVLASCAVFSLSALPLLALGFLVPNVLVLGGLALLGALPAYWQQVWEWGFLYAKSPDPISAGLLRAFNWTGFHSTLVIGAIVFFCCRNAKDDEEIRSSGDRWKFATWLLLSIAGATVGWRFLPRYFDGALPPLLILSARSIALIARDRRRWLGAAAALSQLDRKSTRLNSSHIPLSRMPSSA